MNSNQQTQQHQLNANNSNHYNYRGALRDSPELNGVHCLEEQQQQHVDLGLDSAGAVQRQDTYDQMRGKFDNAKYATTMTA